MCKTKNENHPQSITGVCVCADMVCVHAYEHVQVCEGKSSSARAMKNPQSFKKMKNSPMYKGTRSHAYLTSGMKDPSCRNQPPLKCYSYWDRVLS